MKLTRALLVIVLVLVPTAFVVSQDQGNEDGRLYAITVPAQRVYPHRLGYKVIYNRTDLYPAELYLPGRWFTEAAGRAEIIYSRHPSVPYFTVFYQGAEFSHVRLFVHTDRAHRSWGALPSGEDLRDEFASDTFEIRY